MTNPARLPPGQTLTARFPVVGERSPSAAGTQLDRWELTIGGLVNAPVRLSYAEIQAIPSADRVCDIHCVTRWSRFDARFTGFPLSTLMAARGIKALAEARFIRFLAYSDRYHDTSLPIDIAMDDTWLVHKFEGQPLTVDHGFPLRSITPSKYFYKSLKWVHALEFTDTDVPGFWERTSAYHNRADPWKEERFEGIRFRSRAELDAFRALENFDEYRSQGPGSVLLKLDLSDWTPSTLNLRGLRFKSCSFVRAGLRGADFTNANLTLCRFNDADLRDADFSGADIEGADYSGADLSGARFHRNACSGTTFFREDLNGAGIGLRGHTGMRMRGASGLLERQEGYLQSLGVLERSTARG